ncbi:hypothetical protein ANCCAN_05231 [Ancylostoma caninum]|uniref:Uncharacterized protein n=1 Tax=Ancylostoma caninum TaxID=29170 RepID=A0A368GZJ7_ANCCA|nr:hypothetical protein ANCCAN_05231 [Ancylostoma caninum]
MRTSRDIQIFERLRRFVPSISSERNAFRILVDYVSQVMELEQRLDEPDEKVDVKPQLNVGMPQYRCGYMYHLPPSAPHSTEVSNERF